MKILNKIICILIITMIMLGSGIGFTNNVKATIDDMPTEKSLRKTGSLEGIAYKGNPFVIEYLVYRTNDIEYPVYKLENKETGVATHTFNVNINENLADNKVWRVIMNGYPAVKTFNINTYEAYSATQLAIFKMNAKPDEYMWKDFAATTAAGERVMETAKDILRDAYNCNDEIITGGITITPNEEEWQADSVDDKYVSKTYSVETNVESTKYTVQLDGQDIEKIKITDVKNTEKTEFKAKEKFKILIPVEELEGYTNDNKKSNKVISIKVKTKLKTNPVLIGNTNAKEVQSYALLANKWELYDKTINEVYPVKIVNEEPPKQDGVNGTLPGVIDKNNNTQTDNENKGDNIENNEKDDKKEDNVGNITTEQDKDNSRNTEKENGTKEQTSEKKDDTKKEDKEKQDSKNTKQATLPRTGF